MKIIECLQLKVVEKSCRRGAQGKEASKLFGLYLDHKSSLPKLEESGKGLDVDVYNQSMPLFIKW